MGGKQCRPWSDAASRDVWSGSALLAQACLSVGTVFTRYIYLPYLSKIWLNPFYNLLVCLIDSEGTILEKMNVHTEMKTA